MDYSQSRSVLDSYESTEHVLLDSFKAAAVRVTNLYKDAMAQNRKAFGAGYQQALQDIFEFINTHNGSFTGIPAQSGVVAVDDLVGFAREKSAQLALELGSDNSAAPGTSTTNTTETASSTSGSAAAAAAAAAADAAVAAGINANAMASMTKAHSHRPGGGGGQEGLYEEDSIGTHRSPIPNNTTSTALADKSPFHIDPAAQFTFSAPLPQSLPRYNWSSNSSPWPVSTQSDVVDSLKRRHTELTFMGRPVNNMDVDGSGEPAYKRGKPKQ